MTASHQEPAREVVRQFYAATRLPSEVFCSTDETITRTEWLRRFAITYGAGPAAPSPPGPR